MNRILLSAVLYDPKVAGIWVGIRDYFRNEVELPVEIMLMLNYPAQVDLLLEGKIDVAWNTNLAFVQSRHRSTGACRPLLMRDTDCQWHSKLITRTDSGIRTVKDLRGKKIAFGSRDSGHAAILPIHFLEQQFGLCADRDYQAIRFDTEVGKHGDTGTSEFHVLRAVRAGRADAGAVGSPFWEAQTRASSADEGSRADASGSSRLANVVEMWRSDSFPHCMMTARAGLDEGVAQAFVDALLVMDFDNPRHRPILEAEGLRRWVVPTDEIIAGYASLRMACETQGFFASKDSPDLT
jgi:phosphonate transport system substrate-binding protein